MTIDFSIRPLKLFFNADCMQIMAEMPDKMIDLAIVDPPYGIVNHIVSGGERFHKLKFYKQLEKFDIQPPKEYFIELFRISKNQIIWGANYFTQYLPFSRGWIVWDKELPINFSMAMGELAYTSFNRNLKIFRYNTAYQKGKIHITEKPIKLYKFLLHNYAKPGWLIFDSHVGSASSLIACEDMGFEYIGTELDPDYYRDALERLNIFRSQGKLWEDI